MRLVEGTMVDGRYRFVRRLGSGGMADVWLAEDTELTRNVAIKVLHERFAQDVQFVERFRREAASAAGLQHPNVVGVFDRGEFDGSYYIAMEYVEGSSLKELIDRGLSVQQATEIARQVLAAVRFAHEHGIVHRDIKPQNVIVDPRGRVRVLDFGIARAGASEITQTGSVMGTAQYLSPEQAQGLEVTPASDIYSVGVVLYEMLTGRVPFQGDSAVAVALKQVSEQPAPPSSINPAVTPALDRVVLRALAKDPVNRFASAEEFSRALDAAEADPSGAGLSDTAMFGAVAAPPDEVAAAAAAEDERRSRRRRWIAAAALAALLAAVAVFALTRPDRVNVPSVLERDVDQAELILEEAGFEVAVDPVPSTARRDTVLEQDPRAGEGAEEGSTVTLTVSTGPGRAEVPDVIGLPVREAVAELEDAQFRAEEESQASDTVAEGEVISTDPRPGEEARVDSAVTLVVSTGPRLVVVPSVLGQPASTARSQLEAKGFVVNEESEESDAEEGTVISQEPGGGRVEEGSEVTIVISRGPGDVSVPNVVGQSQEAAAARLAGLGLDVRVTTRDTDSESEDGRVLDQSPEAGAELPPGSEVTIVIGSFVEPEEPVEPEPTDPETEVTP